MPAVEEPETPETLLGTSPSRRDDFELIIILHCQTSKHPLEDSGPQPFWDTTSDATGPVLFWIGSVFQYSNLEPVWSFDWSNLDRFWSFGANRFNQ